MQRDCENGVPMVGTGDQRFFYFYFYQLRGECNGIREMESREGDEGNLRASTLVGQPK